MAKNKALKDNMKKATLITLSMGVGVSAVATGVLPIGSQVKEVHALEVAGTPSLPAEGADFLKDLGDVSHINLVTGSSVRYFNGMQWITAPLPNDVRDVKEYDGKLYATTGTLTSLGKIHRYNDETRVWEQVGTGANAIYDLIKTANGNFIAGGGYTGTYGDYFSIYSSVGDDESWADRMNVYRSNSTNTNNTGAGVFKAGVAVEGETVMFGTSMNWTNIQTTTDDVNFKFKQQIYGNYEEAIYVNGKVIAVGEQSYSGSPHGSIATAVPGGNFTVTKLGYWDKLKDVTYGNGKYVAVGETGSLEAVVYTSTDGNTWTETTLPAGMRSLNAIEFDEKNQRFVAGGFNGLFMSLDGKTWVSIKNTTSMITDIVIADNVVSEYDYALFAMSNLSSAVYGANYKTLGDVSGLQESLDSVLANEVNAVTNPTQKAKLEATATTLQTKINALEKAIAKYAEFLVFKAEYDETQITLENTSAKKEDIRLFEETVSEIGDSILQTSFIATNLAPMKIELLKFEVNLSVERAEASLLRSDYDLAMSKVSLLPFGPTRTPYETRLATVLNLIPVAEATRYVETFEETLLKADYTIALNKVNALPTSVGKTNLIDRIQLAYLLVMRADFESMKANPTYDHEQVVALFKYEFINKITSTTPAVVSAEAELQAEWDVYSDAFYIAKIERVMGLMSIYGYQDAYKTMYQGYYFNLTIPTRINYQNEWYLLNQMSSNKAVVLAVETAEKNFTNTQSASYLNAVAKVATLSQSNTLLKEHLTERLDNLGTAKLTLSMVGKNVKVDYTSRVDGASSYEVKRDGVVIYSGSNTSFVDTNTLGATNYTYEVNVKNADDEVIGSDMVQFKTPINNPVKPGAEVASPTSTNISWGEDKNPETTEYMVQAVPKGSFTPTILTLEEGFESDTQVLTRTGNWTRSGLAKKTGSYALKNAIIGHSGSTTSTFNLAVPASVTDGKVSFDYMVSSEANYDFLTVKLNGVQIVRASGAGTWLNIEKSLQPGNNVLTFTYSKDGSGVKNSDSAFIDNLKASTADTGIKTSGWISEKEYEFTGLDEEIEYQYSVVAKANGLQSETVLVESNNAVEEATVALETLTEVIENLDLTSLENIEDAQEQVDAVQEMIDALPEGDEKDELQGQLDDLQNVLDNAKELIETTNAVDAFMDSLPEELTTREVVQEVKDGLVIVKELVESLIGSEAKTALEERLDTVVEKIALAEQVLDAVESVNELKEAVVSLDTPEAIQVAKDALVEAKELVEALPEGAVKTNLTEQVAEAEEAIALAEQILEAIESVNDLKEAVVSLDTPKAIQVAKDALAEAKELVKALPEGDVKTDLAEQVAEAEEAIKLAVAQDAVEAVVANPSQEGVDNALTLVNGLKDGEAKTELLATLEEVQQAIYLENATALVEKAIETQTQEDVDKAKEALALVKDKGSKAELEEDIQLVQDVIDAKPVQDKLRKFEAKLDTIDKRPQKDEASALQAEYQAIQDGISVLRDGAVKEQLVSELATVKETLDAVLKNGNHPNKAPGQVKKDGVSFISKVLNFIFG